MNTLYSKEFINPFIAMKHCKKMHRKYVRWIELVNGKFVYEYAVK